MTDEQADRYGSEAAQAGETIAAENEDVRERVRRFVVDAVRERQLRVGELPGLARRLAEGAVRGVDRAVPAEATSTLRRVFDGLEDALTTTAHAARLALEEARSKGRHFAEDDLERTAEDLRRLEDEFLDTLGSVTGRARREVSEELRDLISHARRTGTRIRPAVTGALGAAADHPVRLAREAAGAGVEATRQAAGVFLHSMSGLLQAAGDLIRGEDDEEES